MTFRGICRDGSTEVDCDYEESECPFKDVDFTKVVEYSPEHPPFIVKD